jgi:hypothetical protein
LTGAAALASVVICWLFLQAGPARIRGVVHILAADEGLTHKVKHELIVIPIMPDADSKLSDRALLRVRYQRMLRVIAAVEDAGFSCDARIFNGVNLLTFFTNQPTEVARIAARTGLISGYADLEEDY